MTTYNLSTTVHVCEDTNKNFDIRDLLIQAGNSVQGELNIKNFTVLLPDDTEATVNTPLFGMLDTDTVYVRPGDWAANDNAVSTNANSAAAFQLALWELNNDNTNLLTGNGSIKNLYNYTSLSSVNPASQTLLSVSPVPEAQTWAMLVAGLGLLGFMARRRKGASALT